MAHTADTFGVLQDQFDYPAWAKWVFANIPFVMRAYRSLLMARVLIYRASPCHRSCVANYKLSLQSDLNFVYFSSPDSLSQRLLRRVSPQGQSHI
jgi:hypothetical protein